MLVGLPPRSDLPFVILSFFLALNILLDVNSRSRPKSVDDVVHQEEVVRTLKRSIETGNVRAFPIRDH